MRGTDPARRPQPGAAIDTATVLNMRDIGGWAASGGRHVRRGLVYRSAALDRLAGDDVETFRRLGISRVYDLRSAAEREPWPDRLPGWITHHALDVLADSVALPVSRLMAVMDHPAQAHEVLGEGRAAAAFTQAYREFVSLPSALASFHELFSDLADDGAPALIHCATGKDRTGWAVAALLTLLGVSGPDVMAEYLMTNDRLMPALAPWLDDFAAHGGDLELLAPILGVSESYLAAAFDEMHDRFGSIDAYFRDGLGIDATTVAALRRALLEEDPRPDQAEAPKRSS